ncbi:MAG: aminotransferase class IV [Phycisphaerae bacterium]
MNRTVYLNGEFMASSDAHVGVYNAGWLHGAGLFETMRAENRRVFRLDHHLHRLCASAKQLLTPVDRALLPAAETLEQLLERNGLTEARVRLTVSAGSVIEADEMQERPFTVCATAVPLVPYPERLYRTGVAVLISKYRQSKHDPLTGHKTTSYLPRLIAVKQARQAQCTEALWFTPENLLAEGSISNVFIVSGSVVATPPIDTPVLPGIARGVVLELCAAQGIKAQQRAIDVDDLFDADEVFLTNTIMQVMPVNRVEKRDIGGGRPGPVAKGLLEQYRKRVAQECGTDG